MSNVFPVASKSSLDELLGFLGDRADDFKKCFDVESDWCWKYADLMMRNVNCTRELEYSEAHHIIPACFYGKRNRTIDMGNLITLPYGEHLYAHYCAVHCSIGRLKHQMARAFYTMYSIGIGKKRPIFPSDEELIAAIPDLEAKRILGMTARVSKVEREGRTHRWENPVQAIKDYRDFNKEKFAKKSREYREKNKDRIKEQRRRYKEEHPEHVKALRKASYARNREQNRARAKQYQEGHKEEKREYDKKYRADHLEHKKATDRNYYATHAEEIKEKERVRRANYTEEDRARVKKSRMKRRDKKAAYDKVYYAANKERIAIRDKKYRESHKEERLAANRAWRAAKYAAGYKRHKDPITGKEKWVFVGIPATAENTVSITNAA